MEKEKVKYERSVNRGRGKAENVEIIMKERRKGRTSEKNEKKRRKKEN